MLTEATTQQTGNDRYEGYCLDLFEELSQIVKFNYTFKIQDDCTNGKYDNSTGKWNGMIGAIIHGVNNSDIVLICGPVSNGSRR